MGNWEVETTDFNPMKVQTPRKRSPYTYEECLQYTQEADNGQPSSLYKKEFVNDKVGYGLAQWTFPTRKEQLRKIAKELNGSVGDLEVQLYFVNWELTKKSKGADGKMTDSTHMIKKSLNKCGTVEEAAKLISAKYECQDDKSEAAIAKRVNAAEKYFCYVKLVRASIQ